jgi:hypothetical protein
MILGLAMTAKENGHIGRIYAVEDPPGRLKATS